MLVILKYMVSYLVGVHKSSATLRTDVPSGLLLSREIVDGIEIHRRVGVFLDSFLEKGL